KPLEYLTADSACLELPGMDVDVEPCGIARECIVETGRRCDTARRCAGVAARWRDKGKYDGAVHRRRAAVDVRCDRRVNLVHEDRETKRGAVGQRYACDPIAVSVALQAGRRSAAYAFVS